MCHGAFGPRLGCPVLEGTVTRAAVHTRERPVAHRSRGHLAGRAGLDFRLLRAHLVGPVVLERHPEWKLAFVGTGHCHRTSVETVGDPPVIGPDWRLEHYARVRLRIDRATHSTTVVGHELVEVANDMAETPLTIDAALDRQIASWDVAVKRALGWAAVVPESGVHSFPFQSVSWAGSSFVISSHQTSPSGVSAQLVNNAFSVRESIAFGFDFMLVPGATPKKPASGLMA